ncbi:MAG: trigger factor [Candidatus Berkiellales bacterium]
MEVLVENTSTLGRRLKVSVPDGQVKEQIKAKMTQLSREVRLKGFRRGNIPLKVLEQKFGRSVRAQVIEDLIKEKLTDAFSKNDLHPAGLPKIEELKDQSGQDLEFVASFEIYPEIILADLSGVEIEKRTVDITDKDIQKMISNLKDQFANFRAVDRSVQTGDRLTVDFARSVEGAAREEQKNVQIYVGGKGVLPGLDDALIGKSRGDSVEVHLRYPEDWADKTCANKAVDLQVTIIELAEKRVLTEDELLDRLDIPPEEKDKLSEKIRERMQEEVNGLLKDDVKERVLEILLEKNPIELPQALIAQETEAIRREMTRGRSVEGVENIDEIDDSAKKRVELGLLLNEVIKKYSLKADPQRVRQEISKIAQRFSGSPEVMEAYYKNNDLLYSIERMVLLEQAVEAILTSLKIKEKPASFDEVMNPSEGR